MKAPPKNKWFYKFWNNNEKIFIVSELVEVDASKKAPFITSGLGLGYMSAKPLTVKQALKILTSKRL